MVALLETAVLRRMLIELKRCNAIDKLNLNPASTDARMDRYVQRVSRAFLAPMAMISVVQGNRLWLKARHGLDMQSALRSEAFCEHVLDSVEPLEVCDALAHELFRDLPLVTGDIGVRYYIGMPLILSNGIGIGSLCVFDTVKRLGASREQLALLKAMAHQAAISLEYQMQ